MKKKKKNEKTKYETTKSKIKKRRNQSIIQEVNSMQHQS